MDFGAGDIVAGVRLALAIYEYGFVEENAAGGLFAPASSSNSKLTCAM